MDNYEAFRLMIDAHPSGAPQSEAFSKILRMLFSDDEIGVAVHLGFVQKNAGTIAREAGLIEDEARKHLESMAKKMVINSREKEGDIVYSLLPTVPGLFELQFMKGGGTPMHDTLGRLWDEYNNEAMILSLCGEPTPQMRVIPVQKSLETTSRVHTCHEIEHLIRKSDYIAVAHCACKVSRNMCDSPREVCLIFGSLAKAVVSRGSARSVSSDEALIILKNADEAGLVHLSSNITDKPTIICNCCRCCCHFLRGLMAFKNSNAISPSAFEARVRPDDCTACGVCSEKRCPAGAITITEDMATVNADTCIGCGLCVSGCPSSAIDLVPRSDIPEVPATLQDLAIRMLEEKGKLESFMKLMS